MTQKERWDALLVAAEAIVAYQEHCPICGIHWPLGHSNQWHSSWCPVPKLEAAIAACEEDRKGLPYRSPEQEEALRKEASK